MHTPFGSKYALLLVSLVASVSGTHHRHTWIYKDMTRDCKPWVTLRVKIGNHSELHNITCTLSTSALINGQVTIHTSGGNFTARHRVPCLYRSTNTNSGDSVFASEFRGRLKMTFKLNNTWYNAEQLSASSIDAPAVAEKFEAREEEVANLCRYKIPPSNLTEQNAQGGGVDQSRNASVFGKGALNVGSFQGAVVEKQLELVLVVDQSFITKAGGESNAISRVLQIVNFVNGLYQPLRLRVVLTDLFLWSSSNEILVNADSDGTLNRFTEYKAMRMNIQHDTVMLLSAQSWDGGTTLGVAWLRATCKKLVSCGMVTDAYQDVISTALVLTHEIGHNLGFNHMQDEARCVCNRSSTGCIMNSYLASETRTEALGWSSCSMNAWNSQVSATWRSCLADAPASSYSSRNGPFCGDGILDAGEQCDCGPSETCSSNCCNASTCRLKSGAACGSGPCCDWSSCSLKPSGQVCRAANGPCDVAETCSGSSEWCPGDDKVADGVDCASGQAFCYNGQCRTSDTQCQRLFSSSARAASSLCFTTLNVKSEYLYGHCNMRLTSLTVSASVSPTYSYLPCALEDAECGLQHCYQDSRPTTGSSVTFGVTTCYSLPNIDLSSSGLRSPSFVPDGAKCGADSMCVNSTCTPLSTVRACKFCPNCGGNGVLTTGKICFCEPGYKPPNCTSVGCGGSVTSPLACPASAVSVTTAQPSQATYESSVGSTSKSNYLTTPVPWRFYTPVNGVNGGSRLFVGWSLILGGIRALVL